MKRLIVVFVLVLAAAASYRSFGSAETGTGTLTLPPPAPNVGQPAHGFTAVSVEGKPFTLSDKGIYVLTFWSTLNEGSNDSQPGFAQLAREYSDNGVSFAVVYVNSAPTNRNAPYTMLQDPTGKLTSWYNVKRVPRLFVVQDGEVKLVQDGYYGGYKRELEAALKNALAKES